MRTLLILLLSLISFSAAARDVQIYGSPTGGPFRFECPPGHAITGFQVLRGAWIDSIRGIKCGRMGIDLGKWHIINPRFFHTLIGTSNGGAPAASDCQFNHAVNRFRFNMVDALGTRVVNAIDFSCKSVTSMTPSNSFRFLGQQDGGPPRFGSLCFENEIVTGIYGRAGTFIDAIGLICNRRTRGDV